MTVKGLTKLSVACLALPLIAMPAYAHHSFAMFDHDKTQSISGTVKEFQWTNPHVWVTMVVPDATGKAHTWSFEMGGPGQNTAVGWKADSLKPGDQITIGYHPLKDGSNGGQLLTAKLPSGQTLGQQGRPGTGAPE